MKDINQEKVIHTSEGPVLVIAGPGSGKTRTLVERVVFLLLEKKKDPSEILLSTFTEKAARELRFRIQQRLQEEKSSIMIETMYLGTMHSLWLRMLEEYIEYSHYESGIEVLDEEEERFFLYSQLKKCKELEGYREFFEREACYGDWAQSRLLLSIFARIHEEAVSIDSIRSFEEDILFLQRAHQWYERLLWSENKISFSYLQRELYQSLLEKTEFLKIMQDKISYFMIDEYQDTNPIQEKILLLLASKKRNICVVGDEDQAIYRFRGATVENILLFPQHFGEDCEIIFLESNYRSTEEIVATCSRWIQRVDWDKNRYDKKIYSSRYETVGKNTVFHISGSSQQKKRNVLISFLKELKEKKKIEDYSQVVFLFDNFRSSQVKSLEDDFERAGIPVYCPRARNFFHRTEVKLALGLWISLYPESKEMIEKNQYYESCLELARKRAKQDSELLAWILEKRKEKAGDFLENFYEILAFSPFQEILLKQEEDPRRGRESYNLSLLGQLLQKFQYLCKIKVGDMEERERYLSYFFGQYLRTFIEKGVNEFEKKGEFPKDCIPFLTIHQAKGLEFSIVFVGSLYKNPPLYQEKKKKSYDSLFSRQRELQEQNQELYDFYRKYYVAFSRAKNALIFLEAQVSESFQPFINHSLAIDGPSFSWDNIEAESFEESVEQESYSYTGDIASYELCPLRYFFLKKLGFPSLEKENFLFGTIVHRCLERFHRNLGKDLDWKKLVQTEIQRVEKRSKYSLAEGEEEKIQKILEDYEQRQKHLFEEVLEVEGKEYSQQGHRILYGEIDLLASFQHKWKLIDFKTGKEKEEYKEQLLWYASLLRKYKKLEELQLSLYYILEQREENIEIAAEEEEKLSQKIENILEKMENKDFKKREYSKEICDFCEFSLFCERKERI